MTAAVQESLESQLVELSGEAMEAFCEDISTMFEADITSTAKQQGPMTIDGLKKLFKKVCAVHAVKAEGTLDGMFHLIFDQGGLFTLGGVVVMLPQARILEEAKRGTEKDAKAMSDAVGEVGNLLVGTWDRIFRKKLPGHKHFVKAGSFIGSPWDKTQETLGLSQDDELEFALYEMNVTPYPAFSFAVVFPKKLLVAKATATEALAEPVETPPEEQPQEASAPEKETAHAPSESPQEEVPAAKPVAQAEAEETLKEKSPKPAVKSKKAVGSKSNKTQTQAEPEPVPLPTVQETPPSPEVPPAPVAVKAIPEPTMPAPQSQATPMNSVSGQAGILNLPVRQVMNTEVVWSSPEDSVMDVLRQMQQHDVGYALVGQNGVLEGLVSKSNVLGGISPYLRPVFAKWRRPEDDATLNIKIKWLMSRPVQTLGVQATLGQAIERLQQFGGRCLPVVDEAGKVVGMVTVFDILKTLNPNKLTGKTPQAPCLMA
jgi:CBS domain-containing protein